MRVLVFTSLYPNNVWPHHGVFVKERMTRFATLQGCEVKVVAPVPYFPPLKLNPRWQFSQVCRHEVIEGLDVYHPRYFMTPKIGMPFYGLLMFLSVLTSVKEIQARFDFDLIDAHYVYPDGFAAVLLGRLLGKPVVVSARGSDINQFVNFRFIRPLLQYTLQRANQIIAVCQALKDAMTCLGIPESQMHVVPNGVDVRKFYPLSREDARKQLALPTEKKMILSVGGLIPRKGFDLLVRAFKNLLEKYGDDDLSLTIVGEGPSRTELEQQISSSGLSRHVHLVGDVPHNKLYLWYNAADLFCLVSAREGWPNVILESLACGTPVVAANIGGIPEVVRSDEVGLLTERNEQAITKSILLALHKPWQADAILQYAREHTWDRTALSVLRVFETVLKEESI